MNRLVINNKEFDEAVWQDETEFTQDDYNEWLANAIEAVWQDETEFTQDDY